VEAHLCGGENYGTAFHLEYPNVSLSETRRHGVTNRVVIYADTDETILEYMVAPIAFFGLFDIIVIVENWR
jgi:hypothetical protein